jgi:hypothetical protein
VLEAFRTARGIIRSLRIYYGDRSRASAMDRLYSQFVQRGDLVFDVGAHVGDRVASFRRLGARVVAVEPQPALVKVLRVLYGMRRDIVIEPVAVGRSSGTAASSSIRTIRLFQQSRRPLSAQPLLHLDGRPNAGPNR